MQNILSSFTQEKNVCVFANALKTSIEELEKEFLKQNLKFKKIN
ncbi:TPA: RsmB/NOP family class I SAM-dependent RNA methyltransferase, partial [Campylobacter jejuni]|nr:RsmB/NOP family class I SAM-dependent RNA methyltransferase [Campylobacter jejuni]